MNEDVSEEGLLQAITTFANQKLAAGSRQIYSTLTAKPAQLKESTKVVIWIENEAQKETFQTYKQEMLDFLRNELKNNALSLELTEATDTTHKKAYTPVEKFEALKNKNPLLLELKNKLGLEIDY